MRETTTYWGLRLWLLQFGIASCALTSSGKLLGLPLGQVVDVLLPLQFILAAAAAALFCMLCAIHEGFAERSRPSWSLLSYALSPFAAILGYAVFAILYELGPVEQSATYAVLSNDISSSFLAIAAYATRLHVPYSATLLAAAHSFTPQAILAAASLAFALVSARAAATVKID